MNALLAGIGEEVDTLFEKSDLIVCFFFGLVDLFGSMLVGTCLISCSKLHGVFWKSVDDGLC